MVYHQNSFPSNSNLIHEFCIWTDRQTEGLDAFRFFGGVYEVVKKRAGYSLLVMWGLRTIKKKKKNGARIKMKLAWLFITFNVGFAYDKKEEKKTGLRTKKRRKKRIIHSVFVCEASPTEISDVTPCWLSFKRAGIRAGVVIYYF